MCRDDFDETGEPDEIDVAYEADVMEAQRLGVSLNDFMAFKADMETVSPPWPTPEQIADDTAQPF